MMKSLKQIYAPDRAAIHEENLKYFPGRYSAVLKDLALYKKLNTLHRNATTLFEVSLKTYSI